MDFINQIISANPKFSLMGSEEKVFLIERASRVSFQKNQTIIFEGDKPFDFLLISAGFGYVCKQNRDGKRVVLSFCSQGCILGDMSIFIQGERSATVVAATDIQCIRLRGASFETMLEFAPIFVKVIMEQHIKSILGFDARLLALSEKRIASSFNNLIDHLSEVIGKPIKSLKDIPFKLSQEVIADYCCVSREAISRHISKNRKNLI